MLSSLQAATRTASDLAGRVPSSAEAIKWLDEFERLSRAAAAGRLAAMESIRRSRAWQGEGHPSLAHWLAERTGTTVGHAVSAVSTAEAIDQLPGTASALSAGRISQQQATEIALAAAADPDSEPSLLEAATGPMADLRDKCRMVRLAAAGDDAAERARRSRYFRHKAVEDGMVRLDARLPAADAAPLLMACHADADRRAEQSRRVGSIEPYEAHMADALCALAGRSGDGPVRATVFVHVDAEAWERGSAKPGERCEIAGVGPTTVASARRLAAQPGGALKIAIRNDGNVTGVVNTGRYVPALVDSALEARDQRCVIRGCTRRRRLQRDHIVEYARGGATSLENLQLLCGYHHGLKTHKGWRVVGTPPQCTIVPPEPAAPP